MLNTVFVAPLETRASIHPHTACLSDPATPVVATVLVVPYEVTAETFVSRPNPSSAMVAVTDPVEEENEITPFVSMLASIPSDDVKASVDWSLFANTLICGIL